MSSSGTKSICVYTASADDNKDMVEWVREKMNLERDEVEVAGQYEAAQRNEASKYDRPPTYCTGLFRIRVLSQDGILIPNGHSIMYTSTPANMTDMV